VVCHVIGFGNRGGFTDADKTPLLKGVGCESCHGPASLHVEKPDDVKLQAVLNPWRAKAGGNAQRAMLNIDTACQKCHDQDNSVHYKFEEYWEKKKIAH
jgi:hypothetical protein